VDIKPMNAVTILQIRKIRLDRWEAEGLELEAKEEAAAVGVGIPEEVEVTINGQMIIIDLIIVLIIVT